MGVHQWMNQQIKEWIYVWDNLVGIYGFGSLTCEVHISGFVGFMPLNESNWVTYKFL